MIEVEIDNITITTTVEKWRPAQTTIGEKEIITISDRHPGIERIAEIEMRGRGPINVTINNSKPAKSIYILSLGKEGMTVLIAMKGTKIATIEIAETKTFDTRESITITKNQRSKTRLGVNSGSLGTKKRAEDIILSVDRQSMILKEMRVIVHITRGTKTNTANSILQIIDSRLEPTK